MICLYHPSDTYTENKWDSFVFKNRWTPVILPIKHNFTPQTESVIRYIIYYFILRSILNLQSQTKNSLNGKWLAKKFFGAGRPVRRTTIHFTVATHEVP